MAARIGQSLAKRNSVLMEENSKLEAMLGSAREEVTGWDEGRGVCHLRPTSVPLVPGPVPAPACLPTGILSPPLADFTPQTPGELAR